MQVQEHVAAPGFVTESSESIKARLGLPFDPYALEFHNDVIGAQEGAKVFRFNRVHYSPLQFPPDGPPQYWFRIVALEPLDAEWKNAVAVLLLTNGWNQQSGGVRMMPLFGCPTLAQGRRRFRFCTAGIWVRRFGPEWRGGVGPRLKHFTGLAHTPPPPSHSEHDHWLGDFSKLDCYLGEG
jgi:hypothetical protein